MGVGGCLERGPRALPSREGRGPTPAWAAAAPVWCRGAEQRHRHVTLRRFARCTIDFQRLMPRRGNLRRRRGVCGRGRQDPKVDFEATSRVQEQNGKKHIQKQRLGTCCSICRTVHISSQITITKYYYYASDYWNWFRTQMVGWYLTRKKSRSGV